MTDGNNRMPLIITLLPCGKTQLMEHDDSLVVAYLQLVKLSRWLSLRSDFPQAFGIACVLPSHCLALILSDPARAVLVR